MNILIETQEFKKLIALAESAVKALNESNNKEEAFLLETQIASWQRAGNLMTSDYPELELTIKNRLTDLVEKKLVTDLQLTGEIRDIKLDNKMKEVEKALNEGLEDWTEKKPDKWHSKLH